MTVDEGPRRDSTLEALARLKPAFALPDGEDRGAATVGTVTAGNAPGITDGAAATVVASERAVERLGLKPLARIVGYAQAEVAPKWLFLAPVEGVRRLLDRIELPIEAFDLIEINEAFAAQTLADGRELGFDWDKVNVNGGAIALGHPIGASGARIVATLLHELQRRRGPLRPRDPVPRRRRLGRDGVRAGLTPMRTRGIAARGRAGGWSAGLAAFVLVVVAACGNATTPSSAPTSDAAASDAPSSPVPSTSIGPAITSDPSASLAPGAHAS